MLQDMVGSEPRVPSDPNSVLSMLGPQEATYPLWTPYSPFWTVWEGQIIITFFSCCLPSPQGDPASQLPRSPPGVLRGAGQEGRESHPRSEAIFSKGEGLDSCNDRTLLSSPRKGEKRKGARRPPSGRLWGLLSGGPYLATTLAALTGVREF